MAGSWFRSYPSERQQHLPNSRFVRCGIPQGTKFANDTNLTYASSNIYNINNKLNEDLANVTESYQQISLP